MAANDVDRILQFRKQIHSFKFPTSVNAFGEIVVLVKAIIQQSPADHGFTK